MKILYEPKNFTARTLEVIENAEAIIVEYMAQGFNLTLRQLFYQFVARGLIPNTERSYKRIGSIVNDARLAGYLDWDAIEDRTRAPRANSHWNSPAEILESTAASYAIDVRSDQPVYIEVWIEKDALIDVVNRACQGLDLARFSCRGYVSQSAMWRAAQRIGRRAENKRCVILHLGDHDPSGIDMTRDILGRLFDVFGIDVAVKRIALTMEQVEELNPPPNPTKLTDSRAPEYVRRHGNESWELDALDPAYMTRLIELHVDKLTDFDLLTARQEQQDEEKAALRGLIDQL